MRAIQAVRAGGPEVLGLREVEDPVAGPGRLLVEVAAAGVDVVDVYRRTGVHPADFPVVPGVEGAGTVRAVGPGVRGFDRGDRVAWAQAPGSCAELVAVPAEVALPVPDGVDDRTAAALPLQGRTAHDLTASCFPVQQGQDVLVHAAAGGTGALVTQLAAARGARVVATTSTAAEEALARGAGASDVTRCTGLGDLTRDLPAAVRDTRPTLASYTADPDERRRRARELFDAVGSGGLHVRVGSCHPLADAARAHGDLQGRRTTGRLLLLPGR